MHIQDSQNRRIKESAELKGPIGIAGSKSWPCEGQPKIHVPEVLSSLYWIEGGDIYSKHCLCWGSTHRWKYSGTDFVIPHHISDPLSPVQGLPASFINQQMKPDYWKHSHLIIGAALPIYYRASFTKKVFPATDTSLPYWVHSAQFRNTMKLLQDMLL